LACRSNSASEGAQAAPALSVGLNAPAALAGLTATVEQVAECSVSDKYGRESLARRKEKIMGVRVVFAGTTSTAKNFSHSRFKLSDSTGKTFISTLRPDSDCSPLLESGSLAQGEQRRGWVLFQVPSASAGFKVLLKGSDQSQSVVFDPAG